MRFMHFFILTLIFFKSLSAVAANSDKGSTPTYEVSVDAKLYSHFIDRGLSISDKDPAMNVSFLYNLGPQFRMGFWGSNISSVSSVDDHFWFKFIADVRVDFSPDSNMFVYINDDHYYKSSIRNGQSFGVRFFYNKFSGEFEWMNNFQGSNTNAEYLNFGVLFPISAFKAGGKIGYTLQSAPGFDNYFDLKAMAIYNASSHSIIEVGLTAVTNENQFNSRGKPASYISLALSY